MGRQTQAASVNPSANPPRDTRSKIEQRCDKVAWKIKKLESQVWKLEWQVRADAGRMPAAARVQLKRDLEEMVEELTESIARDLQTLAERL